MAKHKLSAMFSDLRGKLNGSKFSKGKSAHTLTNKVKGSNPRTSAQSIVRSAFRTYTSKWQTLAADNILAWNAAAKSTAYKNAFGDSYQTTGHKLYVKLNVEAAMNGGAEIVTPPTLTVPTIVNVDNLDVVIAGDVFNIETLDDLDTGTSLIITATPPMSPGKTNMKGMYRRILTVDAPYPAGVMGIRPAYIAKFGAPVLGKQIGVICYTTDTTKGVKFKAGNDLAGKVKAT